MQFSEQWLRTFVDPKLSTDELCHVLTMTGLEVEEIEPVAPAFTKVVIAEILTAEKHPDADRLQVLSVNVGQAEPLKIVCGASNARAGLKAPCALVGAELPGIAIRQAKVRGVESFGMMCSAKELGLATEANGILELPSDAVPGTDIRDYFLLNDSKITIKLTPNRSDCLSVMGIARDVSAITGASLNSPIVSAVPASVNTGRNVSIPAKDACLRYCGRLITGVNASATTPDWMRHRLDRSGLRIISAIVDVTNYVLLELGQPMHAFDAGKLSGDIQVRYATHQESLVLLNEQTLTLKSDDLVIADENGPVALAGIMGGQASAVGDETKDIFLESAYFTPLSIVGKARRIGLSTDSSYRFERGVDFAITREAMERATALIVEICGGNVGDVVEVKSTLPSRNPVNLRLQKLQAILGIHVPAETVTSLFNRLGFSPIQNGDAIAVVPPSYRFDITIEEDLIEEVARLHGYDHIPAIAPVAVQTMLQDDESMQPIYRLKDTMAAMGYQELVNYSFVDESWETDLLGNSNPIRLKNPIASQLSVMRTGLWGGLIDSLIYNLNRKQTRARLFEVGAVYQINSQQDSAQYMEHTKLAGLAYGSSAPEQWAVEELEVDFFDTKADIETLLPKNTRFESPSASEAHPALHPGQSAKVVLDGVLLGWIGKLHPKWQQHYQLSRSVMLFELDLAVLLNKRVPIYSEVAKFPPVRRDVAIVVDEKISVQDVQDVFSTVKIDAVKEIALFDVYRGKNIDEGKKSLAFLVVMQDTQKTLTDEDTDQVMSMLIDAVQIKLNATLRQ